MKRQALSPEDFQAMCANLETLQARFPKAFPRKGAGEIFPLKEKIHNDILEKSGELGLGLTWLQIRHVLSFWCSRPFYLRAFKKASGRIDLDGNVVPGLSEEHKTHAKERKERLWTRSIPKNISGLNPD